ncbi:MAG: metalloregulator ArsR/SmtB family transcription factor [Actinomycetes bacterium]|jgi:DNA-binding transcriptional ArsR family regulator|nr:ArsR family transcriptional regulator [Acidimicrobiia bacterium]
MVVGRSDEADDDRRFRAVADATRRDILRRTMTREYSVSELARNYPMSFAAVQKHVAKLERAGLVTKRREGREQLVRADVHAVRRMRYLLDQLEAMWVDRIDRMGEILAQEKGDES